MKSVIRFLALLALPVFALAVPNYINYQGRLLDGSGIPVTQSGMSMVVSIWTAPTGGSKLYQENQTVDVDDGVYSFQIGNGTGGTPAWSPTSLFMSGSRFIELTIQGQTLTPRHELLSAPFTLQSGNSDNLGGQPIYYFGTAAGEAALQNQINDLSNQLGSLQVICELSNGLWDVNGKKCLKTIAVLPDKQSGNLIPISQLRKKWTDSEQELECSEPHYHAYPDPTKGGIMAVTDCKGQQTLEEPDPRGCAFGKESAVIYVDINECVGFGGGKG